MPRATPRVFASLRRAEVLITSLGRSSKWAEALSVLQDLLTADQSPNLLQALATGFDLLFEHCLLQRRHHGL